ncbi:hypothetical protein BDV95DRAFT_30417 [Massariosphaeria phaeospora]|uniref:Uncharacterized protein n=1 Tax=Massariosphaeria phaeospora TaxID=100035 RepID=A0A7C8IFV3_9PLEO|nr:hypothetical protein BDV95DRAFT_30417 [Massariosphaeria phaeospora]
MKSAQLYVHNMVRRGIEDIKQLDGYEHVEQISGVSQQNDAAKWLESAQRERSLESVQTEWTLIALYDVLVPLDLVSASLSKAVTTITPLLHAATDRSAADDDSGLAGLKLVKRLEDQQKALTQTVLNDELNGTNERLTSLMAEDDRYLLGPHAWTIFKKLNGLQRRDFIKTRWSDALPLLSGLGSSALSAEYESYQSTRPTCLDFAT